MMGIVQTSMRISRQIDDAFVDLRHGGISVTPSIYLMLAVLDQAGRPLKTVEVARAAGISSAHVSNKLRDLAERRLIIRDTAGWRLLNDGAAALALGRLCEQELERTISGACAN